MPKPLHDSQYRVLTNLLRNTRGALGITQKQLGSWIGEDQAVISKVERGVRRLDVIELWTWVEAMGVPFIHFAEQLDGELRQSVEVKKLLRTVRSNRGA